MNISLLNSPLLSWDGISNKQICENDISKIIQPIYLQNMKTNPWFKQYPTIFEQSNDYLSMCVLSSDVVDDILNKNNVSHHGFENMHVTYEMQNLSLLFHLCVNSQSFMNKFFCYHGKFGKKITKKNTFHKQLITRYNGLLNNVTSITLELNLFLFIFPHGHGAYDGKISVHEYLKFCMNTLFSSFTMYKPYLLIMYDL
jgi:hypothetical protein